MLPDPEKTVISAPFRIRPTPVWFATQPGILPALQALPWFEAAPPSPSSPGSRGRRFASADLPVTRQNRNRIDCPAAQYLPGQLLGPPHA